MTVQVQHVLTTIEAHAVRLPQVALTALAVTALFPIVEEMHVRRSKRSDYLLVVKRLVIGCRTLIGIYAL